MDTNENDSVRHGHRIPWLTILFAILCLAAVVAVSDQGPRMIPIGGSSGGYSTDYATKGAVPPMAEQERAGGTTASSPAYYPQPSYDVPVTDTREFLKIDYNAMILTRDVRGLTKRAETTVKGFGGRIDNTSSSDKYGYINFVIPASKLDAFRNDIESFVGSRFITINVSTQNLLPQKQDIEAVQTQVTKNLADLKAGRQKAVAAHSSAVASLQSQIDDDTRALTDLRATVTSDPARQAEINARINELSNEVAGLRSRLANENSSYAAKISSYDSQITYTGTSLEAVEKQDQRLLDNVATVHGSITLQWISLWDMIRLYLPGYWIPAILGLFAILAFLWERRRFHV